MNLIVVCAEAARGASAVAVAKSRVIASPLASELARAPMRLPDMVISLEEGAQRVDHGAGVVDFDRSSRAAAAGGVVRMTQTIKVEPAVGACQPCCRRTCRAWRHSL